MLFGKFALVCQGEIPSFSYLFGLKKKKTQKHLTHSVGQAPAVCVCLEDVRSEGLWVANIMDKFGHLGACAPVRPVGVHSI